MPNGFLGLLQTPRFECDFAKYVWDKSPESMPLEALIEVTCVFSNSYV